MTTLSDEIIFNGLNTEDIEDYNWKEHDHAVIKRRKVKEAVEKLIQRAHKLASLDTMDTGTTEMIYKDDLLEEIDKIFGPKLT